MGEPISTVATGVAVAAGKEVVTVASKGIGQTVSDMWYSIYGYKWSEKRQKREIEVAYNVEKFKEEIQAKSNNIPEENRIEPDIDVIGSTLESAKYRINKDEIRDMFSNLIVSAMDSSKADDIHPSFSEMIKMLSPLDAQNLYCLYHYQDETISQIQVNFESGGYQTLHNHIFLGNPECQDNALIEPSIDNLVRLKLVDVTYTKYKTQENLYEKHFSNPLFLSLKKEIEQTIESTKLDIKKLEDESIKHITRNGELLSDIERKNLKEELQRSMFKDVELIKGIIRLTALGRNFCKVCL
ncbi:hypothetical protein JP28_12565 [Gallibacterium anatis]|uniref:DUF4393 domain-containing protein n=1 Tax=Gallibacterium anatis TaxID=750 RepID=UPI000531E8E8|nr:DUF4393 domain-containing protein [Gallibacterium anatis]KGQ40842.1 hypothetical protein JP28_12565 [Gallibacterium anatis]KGQ47346.1 hypothetical protein IO46_13290 [Gallibacterium anatis]KGQ57468.1 hypothetical protein IO45_11060 [Gallibacterium anatis]